MVMKQRHFEPSFKYTYVHFRNIKETERTSKHISAQNSANFKLNYKQFFRTHITLLTFFTFKSFEVDNCWHNAQIKSMHCSHNAPIKSIIASWDYCDFIESIQIK